MARGCAGRNVAVRLDTLIQSRAGSIAIEGTKFRYQREDGRVVEGEFSIEALDAAAWSVLIGGRSYLVEPGGRVEPGAADGLTVNGARLAIELFDPRASRGRQGSAANQGRVNIAAQMPGKVVRLLVSAGESVEQGQGLVVVEAMKMQNEMKSPKAGRVVEVRAKPDSTVAAGEVLMVVE
jgi:acetyl/propionyl-CoA carboxylase alpha subunit